MFGKYYDEIRAQLEQPPSYVEWIQKANSVDLLEQFGEYANFGRITSVLLGDSGRALVKCAGDLKAILRPELIHLLRNNIARRIGPGVEYASPFVRKFCMSRLNVTMVKPIPAPLHSDGSWDVPLLIVEVVKNMNRLQITAAPKQKQNSCASRAAPGPKEDSYKNEFHRTLLQLFKNDSDLRLVIKTEQEKK
jgi:hypothetical protein